MRDIYTSVASSNSSNTIMQECVDWGWGLVGWGATQLWLWSRSCSSFKCCWHTAVASCHAYVINWERPAKGPYKPSPGFWGDKLAWGQISAPLKDFKVSHPLFLQVFHSCLDDFFTISLRSWLCCGEHVFVGRLVHRTDNSLLLQDTMLVRVVSELKLHPKAPVTAP